jgi:uncharacterized protein YyaL (SSP411 family)
MFLADLNLHAGLPLTSFITPDGKLYFAGGYLPAEHKADNLSFREAAEEVTCAGTSFQFRRGNDILAASSVSASRSTITAFWIDLRF